MQYSCSSGHVTTLGADTKLTGEHDDDSGCGDDSASSYGSSASNSADTTTNRPAYTPAQHHGIHVHSLTKKTTNKRWLRGGTVVESWSLTGELSLSCARPAADG